MKLTRIFARYLEQKQQRPGVFSRPFAYPYLAPLWAWIMGAFHACHIAGAFGVMARFVPRLHRPYSEIYSVCSKQGFAVNTRRPDLNKISTIYPAGRC